MENITPEKILDAIKRSGYLFEQAVANYFETQEFHVTTNAPFLDPDEGKSREIDINAYRLVYKEGDFYISLRFIVECKNNTNPFVFFRRAKNAWDKTQTRDIFMTGAGADNLTVKAAAAYNFVSTSAETSLDFKYPQFCKINRNQSKLEAQHSGVIESLIYPLIKARKTFIKRIGGDFVNIIIPVVICNSQIYEICASDPEPMPKEIPFLTFTREFHGQNVKGKHDIDFVSFEYIEHYLALCADKINDLVKFLKDYKKENEIL